MFAYIGILLIFIGVLAIIFMPDEKKQTSDSDADQSTKSTSAAGSSDKSEEELKK